MFPTPDFEDDIHTHSDADGEEMRVWFDCPICAVRTPYYELDGNIALTCKQCCQEMYPDKPELGSSRSRPAIRKPPYFSKLTAGNRVDGTSQIYVAASSSSVASVPSSRPSDKKRKKANRSGGKGPRPIPSASSTSDEVEDSDASVVINARPKMKPSRLVLSSSKTPRVEEVADADKPPVFTTEIVTVYSPHLVVSTSEFHGWDNVNGIRVPLRCAVSCNIPIPLMTRTTPKSESRTRIGAFNYEIIDFAERTRRLDAKRGAYILSLGGKYRGMFGDCASFVGENRCPLSMANCCSESTPLVSKFSDERVTEPNCELWYREHRMWLVPVRNIPACEEFAYSYEREVKEFPWSAYPMMPIRNFIRGTIPYPGSFGDCAYCVPYVCLHFLKRLPPTNIRCTPECARDHPLSVLPILENRKLLLEMLEEFWPFDENVTLNNALEALRELELPASASEFDAEYVAERDNLVDSASETRRRELLYADLDPEAASALRRLGARPPPGVSPATAMLVPELVEVPRSPPLVDTTNGYASTAGSLPDTVLIDEDFTPESSLAPPGVFYVSADGVTISIPQTDTSSDFGDIDV